MSFARHWTRRRFLLSGAASVFTVGSYAWRIEPHWVEVVHRAMPIQNLPTQWEGATLVQMSDLHIGPQVDDQYLLGVFQRVNNLAPDIVVYTGDFVSSNTDLVSHAPRVMASLPLGTRGTFGILGNHDYGHGWHNIDAADRIVELAVNAGIRILRNESVDTQGLKIHGLDELWADRLDLSRIGLSRIGPVSPANDAAIALVHNPDAADLPGWGNYAGWILAGHTHGGQCKPPFLPPPLLPVANRRYSSGVFDLSVGCRMYINRGVGYLRRIRFNVRPEVTVFEMRRAATWPS
jgi:predicted MPP superfamily phosphohydrolase